MGKQWGKELKHGTVTMEQFVTFLRHDILNASDNSRSSFQVGFLKGYGKNGLSIYTQALSWPKEGVDIQPSGSAKPPAEVPTRKGPVVTPKHQD